MKYEVNHLPMGTTFERWEATKKKDQASKIEAAIKEIYKPKILTKAIRETVTLLQKK